MQSIEVKPTDEGLKSKEKTTTNGGDEPAKKGIDLKMILIIILGFLFLVALVLAIALPLHYKNQNDDTKYHSYKFKYWSKDAEPIKKLKKFVKEITKKGKDTYIPAEERVAVFDMDGTLIGEKAPTYLEWVFYKAFVQDHPDLAEPESHQDIVERIDQYIADNDADVGNLDRDQLVWHAKAFKDWTLKQTEDYIDEFVKKDVPGFKNLKYEGLFFKPMVEIVNFLQKNFFKVVVVTGSERYWVRHYVHKYLPSKKQIPKTNFIGADIELVAKGEREVDGYEEDKISPDGNKYKYTHNDYLVRSGNIFDENMYMGKVKRIVREIGVQPVLAFGNSNGDVAMMNYVTTGNPHKSLAFMLVADDREREYGVDDAEIKKLNDRWTDDFYGYTVISMKNDWKTIYGEDVTITK